MDLVDCTSLKEKPIIFKPAKGYFPDNTLTLRRTRNPTLLQSNRI